MQAKGIKVLSLFDGISCARVALDRAGIEVAQYYSSEIDKYAMQISAKNWPEIVQIGGVTLSALGGGCGAKTGLYCVSTLTERRTEEAKRIRSESMKNGKANTLTTGITKEHLVVLVGKARGKNPGYESSEKTATLTGSSWQHNYFLKLYNEGKLVVRKLTPIECERLQSINKDGYTSCVSDAQRYKACGNAFNVEVIAHILKSMKL